SESGAGPGRALACALIDGLSYPTSVTGGMTLAATGFDMHMARRSLVSGVFLLLLSLASGLLAEDRRQPTHEFTLENGLKVIVREDHRAPVVVSQLWYRVGSSYEPPGRTGMSHALEHMMFKGSERLAPGQASRLL